MRWQRLYGLILVSLLFLPASTAVRGDDESESSADREHDAGQMDDQGWIAFDGSGGHIRFDVLVNDTPASAILDTGADATMISEGLAERADIELDHNRRGVEITGIYGQERIPLAREFNLRFATIDSPMRNVPVAPGDHFDLVLNRSLFEASIVQIDYPNERIRFLSRDIAEIEGNLDVRQGNRGAPMVRAEIHDEEAWMLLDTGNNGASLLKRRFVRRSDLEEFKAESARGFGTGAVDEGVSRVLQIPEFDLGPYAFESLLAQYLAENNEGLDGDRQRFGSRLRVENSRYDGILGYEVLQNFVVTMDLEREEIHLFAP